MVWSKCNTENGLGENKQKKMFCGMHHDPEDGPI